MPSSDEKLENGYDAMHAKDIDQKAPPVGLNSESGDELIPQPSSDPRDPLVSQSFAHVPQKENLYADFVCAVI